MKFIFITQEDPFYVKTFFENFFKNYKDLDEIEGVVICRTMGRSFPKLLKQMYGFYGTIDFGRVGVRYLANKVLDVLIGKFYSKKYFSIKLCVVY